MELWENRTVSTQFFLLLPPHLNSSNDLYRLPSKNKIPNPDYDGNDVQKEESTQKGVAPNFDDMKQMVIKHNYIQQLRYLIFSFFHFLSIFLQLLKEPSHLKEHSIILSFNYIGIYSSEYNRAFRHQAGARYDGSVAEHGMVSKEDRKRVFTFLHLLF